MMVQNRGVTGALLAAFFLLSACHRPYYIQEHHDQFYSVKSDKADSGFVNMLAPYKKSMDAQMQVVIGHADTTLYKAQPESTLGNFLADAELRTAKKSNKDVVAAVANYGGIRVPYISAGDITLGRIYELMPFAK